MPEIKVELDDSICRSNPTKATIKIKPNLLMHLEKLRKRFSSGKLSHTTSLTVSKKAFNGERRHEIHKKLQVPSKKKTQKEVDWACRCFTRTRRRILRFSRSTFEFRLPWFRFEDSSQFEFKSGTDSPVLMQVTTSWRRKTLKGEGTTKNLLRSGDTLKSVGKAKSINFYSSGIPPWLKQKL